MCYQMRVARPAALHGQALGRGIMSGVDDQGRDFVEIMVEITRIIRDCPRRKEQDRGYPPSDAVDPLAEWR
jgi:hypothetical protein